MTTQAPPGDSRRMRHAVFLTPALALLALACSGSPSTHDAATGGLRIYLARHGQTDWNKIHKLQGHTDIPLNETGKAQAAELAKTLEGIHLDAIYSSTLSRSRETAAALTGRAPITALPELIEQGLGKFEGSVPDDANPAIKAEYERRVADPKDSLDGGESAEQVLARVGLAIARIRAEHPSGVVLVVGHSHTNQEILRSLLELTAEQTDKIYQANDEVYAIDLVAGAPPHVWKHVPKAKLEEL